MFFSVTSCRTFFEDPLPSLYWWAVLVDREELKWCQLAPANEPAKDFVLVHAVQLNLMIKAQISGRMVSSGISDVAFTQYTLRKPV